MRKLLSGLGVMLLAGGLSAVAGISPAHAQCPSTDGTLPGSSASVIVIGEQTLDPNASTRLRTLFIDDRDFADVNPAPDGNGIAGGLWVFAESGGAPGLQRGGDQIIFTAFDVDEGGPLPGLPGVNPNVPFIAPVPVLPPNPGGAPVFPSGLTLFPEGFGGGSLSEAVGSHDDCLEATPDIILF